MLCSKQIFAVLVLLAIPYSFIREGFSLQCSALPLYVRFLRYLRQRYLEGDESVSPAVIRQSFEEALAAVGLHIPLGTSFSRRSVCYEYSPFFC